MRLRKKAGLLAVALLALLPALSAVFPAAAAAEEFGFANLDVTYENEDGSPALLAGSHPYAINFEIDSKTEELPGGATVAAGAVKTLKIEQSPGFAGLPEAVPPCPTPRFLEAVAVEAISCPNESVVGKTTVTVGSIGEIHPKTVPVYNLEAPPGAVLKLGFIVQGVPVTFEVGLSPVYPFDPVVTASNLTQVVEFFSTTTTVWGNPSSPAHDEERGTCLGGAAADKCPVPARAPFLTLPRSCTGPLPTLFEADSWQDPATWVKPPPVLSHDDSEPPQPQGLEDCAGLEPFEPEVQAQPTSAEAESPAGLDFELATEDEGLFEANGRAESDMEKVVVRLPEGVNANPSLAAGLGACSEADFGRESLSSEPGEGCPEDSKIGTVEAETPLLKGAVAKGQLYLASPYANPYGTLLALYLVVREPERGVFVALPGKVEADPQSGRLTTTFGEAPYKIPQFPISHLQVHLRSGDRAPLATPAGCGHFPIEAELTPWGDPTHPLTLSPSFQVDAGPGGAPCPGAPAFAPGFKAGSIDNLAGAHSPFFIQLTREDGQRDLTRFSATLPPGLSATLAGVDQCSEAAIAAARTKTGTQEHESPSCPAGSRIGGVVAGAGVGPALTYVEGSLYLAGPFKGAPLSVVAVVPALAGPFDLGTVVVREALRVDPRSAQVTVDSDASEPFPRILAGIPVHLREVRAFVDRPGFTFNPTSCNPFTVGASIWGGDSGVAASAHYQAASCGSLGFKPKLSIRLQGGTTRNSFPALHAVLTPRPGDANIAAAVVRLPHSVFLEQGHIGTICTRVQFAAHACPARSVYGHATAYTPVLPGPAEGPVYLRSSDHSLPDLVMALKGPASVPVEAEVVGRIDSKNGGIRTSFEEAPDLPVSKLALDMQGGKKGLIVNSRNLCFKPQRNRAAVALTAQNGLLTSSQPVVTARCKKPKPHGKR